MLTSLIFTGISDLVVALIEWNMTLDPEGVSKQ